jgi:hypothetical protein
MKTNNNLNLNYSELDKFIMNDDKRLKVLFEGFHKFHDLAVWINHVDELFQLILNLTTNPEREPKQGGVEHENK